MAAGRDQAAADEDDRRRADRAGPARRACRAAARPRRCQPPGPPRHCAARQRRPAASTSGGTECEPLGVARGQQQGRVRDAFAQAPECARAPAPLRPRQCCPPPTAAGPRRAATKRLASAADGCGARAASNFRLPGDAHALGRRPERADAIGVGVGLHQEQVDLGEHAAAGRREPAVAREGALREAAVDDGDAYAAPLRLVDQVRPELASRRAPAASGSSAPSAARTGRGKSKGAIEQAVDAAHALRATAWPVTVVVERKTLSSGKRSLSGADERPRGQDLAHRDRVDPDRPPLPAVQARPAGGPMRSRKVLRYLPVPRPFQR